MGTVFALANPEAAIRILWEVYPQTKATGKDEATALRDDLATLKARAANWPPEAGGVKKWGENSIENYDKYVDFLVANGVLKQKIDAKELVTNDLIDDINKFDAAEVTKRRRTTRPNRPPRPSAGRQAVLGAPGRAGTAHIVQFRPVGADGVAGQFAPEAGEEMAGRGKGGADPEIAAIARAMTLPHHAGGPSAVRLSLGRPVRRQGSRWG